MSNNKAVTTCSSVPFWPVTSSYVFCNSFNCFGFKALITSSVAASYDMPFNIYAPIGEAWILSALGKNNSPIINIKNNKNLNCFFRK